MDSKIQYLILSQIKFIESLYSVLVDSDPAKAVAIETAVSTLDTLWGLAYPRHFNSVSSSESLLTIPE